MFNIIVFLTNWNDWKEWLFLTAAAFGMCDSIWQTALSAVYGTLFPQNKEAAFSNKNFWRSLGSVTGIIDFLVSRKILYIIILNSSRIYNNHNLWNVFLAFAYGHVLPVHIKTVLNLALLVVGFFFYCVVEFIARKRWKLEVFSRN